VFIEHRPRALKALPWSFWQERKKESLRRTGDSGKGKRKNLRCLLSAKQISFFLSSLALQGPPVLFPLPCFFLSSQPKVGKKAREERIHRWEKK